MFLGTRREPLPLFVNGQDGGEWTAQYAGVLCLARDVGALPLWGALLGEVDGVMEPQGILCFSCFVDIYTDILVATTNLATGISTPLLALM